MNLKQIFSTLSGYWVYKKKYLPLGIDLFVDLKSFFKINELGLVMDVGANIGQSITLFQTNIPFEKIISFEPIPSTFLRLKNNWGERKKIKLENIGLAEKEYKTKVKINKHSELNSLKEIENTFYTGETEEIEIATLDQYVEKNKINQIDFLKIDTEGYEMQVLDGATEAILNKKIQFIYCEVGFSKENQRHTHWNIINEFLTQKGYKFVALYDMSYKVFKQDHSGNALYVLNDFQSENF